ncbi:hypothetical protein BO78DRAFT_400134 [Aspergillus sclerotiicarbonarius CBS 121057]|uniref:Uncharacterized protein n=1 Tax=Aspergillus sclerotiicarbonarius (strain CBS 121057 / IBT 28362) TaxID=1448318 RepID=A0A319DYU1_ASPSB|nr:hypothetical protein BO78DRAFT_400134 [Aspergillus sclerotiicarbonarius CBS 121057]
MQEEEEVGDHVELLRWGSRSMHSQQAVFVCPIPSSPFSTFSNHKNRVVNPRNDDDRKLSKACYVRVTASAKSFFLPILTMVAWLANPPAVVG